MIENSRPNNNASSRLKNRPVTVTNPKSRATAPKKKVKFLSKTWHKVALGVGIFLVLVITIVAVIASSYQKKIAVLQNDAQTLMTQGRQLMDQISTQNIPAAAETLKQTEISYDQLKQTWTQFSGLKALPGYGHYISDVEIAMAAGDYALEAGNKTLNAILPYADLLGFSGEENSEGGTAEDRVKTIIETLSVITPELDAISADLTAMQTKLEEIDTSKYPTKLNDLFLFKVASFFKSSLKEQKDLDLKAEVDGIIALADQASTTFSDYRPVIELAPEILGGTGQRKKYLVLFQNDNELRPTGGFLTAYSIIYVEDGKVTPEKSDDIYELDKKFSKKLPIPAELGRYLTTEKYWNLRDMNIYPDFKKSMDVFLENYQTVRGEPQDIDGIIAIDTKLLTDLVDLLGPVEVAGYGTFSTEPDKKYTDAPQIVVALSEIITRPTPYIREDRKGILGPMMQAIIGKVYSAPGSQMPGLFTTVINGLEGRHVQVYFLNEELQAAIETINAAGRMKPVEAGKSDFLAIVDANLGGAKSNLFISYEVNHLIEAPEAGQLNKKVEITYSNSRPGDNCNLEAGLLCLNSTNNDWQRVYLPEGAKLIKAQGYKNEPNTYSEDGFTIIDGFFSLDPNKTAKVVLEYTVPYENEETYQVQLWKQGGIDEIKNFFNVNGNEEEITITKDTLYTANFD